MSAIIFDRYQLHNSNFAHDQKFATFKKNGLFSKLTF